MKRAGGGGEREGGSGREGGYWVKSLLDLGRRKDALACFLLLCGWLLLIVKARCGDWDLL